MEESSLVFGCGRIEDVLNDGLTYVETVIKRTVV